MENLVELNSNDIVKDNIEKLKQIFPDIVTDGNIDFDTLKTILGEEIETDNESYKFEWVGKQNCYKTIQTPSNGTLKYIEEDSLNPYVSENLIIEGDNLEVLKLLQSSYKNSIKMIYIDPPYNTGNDFVYPDNFETPLDNYFELTGQKENGEDTQSKKSKEGRKHTQWLNMLFPRLLLSRTLLKKDDGVIFISIDDNEYDNLKKLCDEVFGEENFVSTIIWEKKFSPQNDSKWFSDTHDYILCYSNNKEKWRPILLERTEKQNSRYTNLDNDKRGIWSSSDLLRKDVQSSGVYTITTPSGREVNPPSGRSWRVPEYKFIELVKDNRIWFGEDGSNVPRLKRFLSEVKDGVTPMTIWKHNEVGHNQESQQELRKIFEGDSIFDTPKPIRLLKKLLHIGSKDNDIVLDFFGGSGTTGHSILELNKEDGNNRRFILVQLPEPTSNPDYPYISDITKERIRRVINGYGENPQPINDGFKVFKLDNSNYKINEKINVNKDSDKEDIIKKLRSQFKTSTVHDESLVDGYNETDVIYENIIKEGYNLNSKIELIEDIKECNVYKVSNSVNTKKFYITFDKVDTRITENKEFMGISNDTLFICFEHNLSDSDKTNLTKTFLLKTI